MRYLSVALNLLLVPLAILNLLAGTAAAVWLGVLGEWRAILLGIVVLVGGHYVISFATLPGLLLAPLALRGKWINKPAGGFLALLGLAYSTLLIVVWCGAILLIFLWMATPQSRVPMLFWSYEVATGPWSFLAYKDQQSGGNEFSAFTTLLAELAYVITAVLILTGTAQPGMALIVFGTVMLIGIVLQAVYAFSMTPSAEPEGGSLLRATLHLVPRVFGRVFSRIGDSLTPDRPRGYKWGYVFATANGMLGAAAAVVASMLLLAVSRGAAGVEEAVRLAIYALLLIPYGLTVLALSVCAFTRRSSLCYLVIVVGLLAGLGLHTLNAVWGLVQGAWIATFAASAAALLQVTWLAYFGNRRHMFGYLREQDTDTPSSRQEQLVKR